MNRSAVGVAFATAYAAFAVLALTGCGSDYEPPRRTVTGVGAGVLAPIFDLELDLPHLRMQGAASAGARLTLRFQLLEPGPGRVDARFVSGAARWDMQSASLERIAAHPARIEIDNDGLSSDGLGPFRVRGTVFDVFFDGTSGDGGWGYIGTATETQTGFPGSLQAWRQRRFLVATSDFLSNTGRIAEVAWVRDERIEVRDGLETVSSDSIVALAGPSVFGVNRLFFDNLQRLDPAENFATTWQSSVSAGSNPQDVARWEDLLFVSRYEPPFNDVAVLTAEDGSLVESVPLDAVAQNPDRTPRAADLLTWGDRIFVAVQDIDRTFQIYEQGQLAVIDAPSRMRIGSIPLGGVNPTGMVAAPNDISGPRIYVSLSGIYPVTQAQQLTGGVAVVDPIAMAFERMALDDDDAGGNLGPLVVAGRHLAYSVVSDAQFGNRILAWDPESGAVLRTVRTSMFLVPSLALGPGGILAIPDRSPNSPGICLYRVPVPGSSQVGELFLGCGTTALPPGSLVSLEE